ncbi:MAG: alkaline phosphatase [Methanoregulaceae archaeon]|nr:alkaline phosphatase [Methanoregulaceae archaeon]
MAISRRSVLGAGALGALGLALPNLSLGQSDGEKRRAKNVIFCVSDGMSLGTLSMVDQLSRLLHGRPSYWAELLNQEYVVNGFQETRSLNSVVTDSAAAASTWGSGRRIWSGALNEFPDGTKLRTLTQLLGEAKVRTGLVTTATITHATPAGFCVNAPTRDNQPFIATQYLASGVDVLMGGGTQYFDASKRTDKRDLFSDFAKAGYAVAKSREEMLAIEGSKALGIYSNSHLPYWVDHMNSPELMRSTPTLAEMSRKAIDMLKGSDQGFLLQIEGAKIDHAAHGNDLAGLIYDQIAFEAAVKVAIDFAIEDGETLVVITTDHGNASPTLNGAGAGYGDSEAGLARVAKMKSSYDRLFTELGTEPKAAKIRESIEAHLGIAIKPEEAELLAGKSPFASSIFYGGRNATLSVILGNYTKVTWTSGNHTSDHVLCTAFGPGKEAFHGLTPNVASFANILAHYDIRHENPKMTYEEAKKIRDAKNVKDGDGGLAAHLHADVCDCD